MRKAYFITLLLLFVSLTHAWAQEAVVPAGGDASSSGGSVSFSLNYVAYPTVSGPGGTVSPGLLHPIETFVISSTTRSKTLKCDVFPNPTVAGVTLKTEGLLPRHYSYKLCDLLGRVVQEQTLDNQVTSIPMEHLPAAVYILKISQNNKEAQSFKIIKH